MASPYTRKSRKQPRREGQPLAPGPTAGKNVCAFRRVTPGHFPRRDALEGRTVRRGTPEPVDETLFWQPPDRWFRRVTPGHFPRRDALEGRTLRRHAKPPAWVKYAQTLSGAYRAEDTTLSQHELYRGIDTSPDYDAAPWETW